MSAPRSNHEDGYVCAKCHEDYSLRENCEPSEYCDRCVHDVLEETQSQLTAALARVAELTEQLDYSRQQHQSTWAKLHRQTENITGLNARVQELSRELLASRAKVAELDIRRRESRHLLTRMVKYCREDEAKTPGVTRLARLVEKVADYLNRTHDPRDMLRLTPDSAAAEYLEKEGKDG